ncbi:hypothetical protein WME83_02100 [Sorangium sp. So ce385]
MIRAILKSAATIGEGFPLPLIRLTAVLLRVRLRASPLAALLLAELDALLLAELDALLLAALLLAELGALLLAALLLAELGALLLAALLLAELGALLLAALLLAELGALLLAALLLAELGALQPGLRALLSLLLDALLAELGALLLAALLLRLLLRALLLHALLPVPAALLPVLGALLLAALLPVLGALLLAALLLLLQQRAEELLGLPQVLLDVRSHRLDASAQLGVVRARDERHVEELEGAAMEGDLRPDVGDVELGAFLVFQRLAQLGRAGLELLAARAGLDVGPAALRQLRPALPRLRVLLDDLLGVALHLRGFGLVSGDLRQLDLLPVDERDQHRDLRLRPLLHRALPAGLPAVALPTANLAAASLPAALIAGLLAALVRAAHALPAAALPALLAGLPAAALPALLAGLLAAALPALLAGLPAASLPAAGVLAAALPASASRAVSACLAAAPVCARGAPAGPVVAGRPPAARLGIVVAADAAASPREDKAPREHDRHEAT